MQAIESIEALEAHYGKVSPLALSKVCDHITALYQRWIKASRFMILSTVGPGGTDASPRGDSEDVVRIVDAKTLWLPDWKGNNRLDSLKNIVEDGRLSLLFMVLYYCCLALGSLNLIFGKLSKTGFGHRNQNFLLSLPLRRT